jgi:hypothetical protein
MVVMVVTIFLSTFSTESYNYNFKINIVFLLENVIIQKH